MSKKMNTPFSKEDTLIAQQALSQLRKLQSPEIVEAQVIDQTKLSSQIDDLIWKRLSVAQLSVVEVVALGNTLQQLIDQSFQTAKKARENGDIGGATFFELCGLTYNRVLLHITYGVSLYW